MEKKIDPLVKMLKTYCKSFYGEDLLSEDFHSALQELDKIKEKCAENKRKEEGDK